MRDRIDDLLDLSKRFSKLTFNQKLRLLEEAAELLRKGRSMREVLEETGRDDSESWDHKRSGSNAEASSNPLCHFGG